MRAYLNTTIRISLLYFKTHTHTRHPNPFIKDKENREQSIPPLKPENWPLCVSEEKMLKGSKAEIRYTVLLIALHIRIGVAVSAKCKIIGTERAPPRWCTGQHVEWYQAHNGRCVLIQNVSPGQQKKGIK